MNPAWILCLVVLMGAPAFAAADDNPDQEWNDRLTTILGQKAGYEAGRELLELPADKSFAILSAAWLEIKDGDVKRGLLKALNNLTDSQGDLHPRLVQILHLGMTDPSPDVRRCAADYLRSFTGEDFSRNQEAYMAWYEKFGHLSKADIIDQTMISRRPKLKILLADLVVAFETGDMELTQSLASQVAEYGDPFAIPTLIGIIDADNSHHTIYYIGYFTMAPMSPLGKITRVDYSFHHDGAWWRRWWEQNKKRFSKEVQQAEIPKLKKTENGAAHVPYPENLDTLEGKIAYIPIILQSDQDKNKLSQLAKYVGEHKDPKAIPYLIGLIAADDTEDTIYGVGYFGLGEITDVPYSPSHDAAWWLKWWEEHKSDYSAEIQDIQIPDYKQAMRAWKVRHRKSLLKRLFD